MTHDRARNRGQKPLINRRDAMRVGAAGAVLAGLGASARADDCDLSPSQTAGPFWVDEMLNRSDLRYDPSNGTYQPGLPLRLMISVSQTVNGECSPLAGAYVDLWHCNVPGKYSDEQSEGTLGQKWLRGYQATDAHGIVRFLTIYPGYYIGRTVHIHARVRTFDGEDVTFNFTSQLYFDDVITDAIFKRESPYNQRPDRATRNNNDNIFAEEMLLRLSDNGDHAVASFNLVVDLLGGRPGGPGQDLDHDHDDEPGGGRPPVGMRSGGPARPRG